MKFIRSAVAVAMTFLAVAVGTTSASATPVAHHTRPATAAELKLLSTYPIRPLSNLGTCLDVYANGKGPWVQVWTCNGQGNQQFYAVNYADNSEIRSADTWCVDGRYGRGASLQHSQCTGIVGQRFRAGFDIDTQAYFFESVQYPGQVWDVYANGQGTEVQLWDENLTPNQEWVLG